MFLNELNNVKWSDIINDSKNLHESTSQVIDKVKTITNKHAPMKEISSRKKRLFDRPWITKGILKSIKKKQKMYRTHYLSNNLQKQHEYKRYCNRLNQLKKKSKDDYYSKQFNAAKHNLKYTWKLIGTLIKRGTKGQTTCTRLKRHNKEYTNELDSKSV